MSTVIVNRVCANPYCEISRTGARPEFILQAELPINMEKTLYIFISYEGLPLTDDDMQFMHGVLEWARKVRGNMDCCNIEAALEKLHHTQCTRPEKKNIEAVIKAFDAGYTGFMISTRDALRCERAHYYGTTPGICGALIGGSYTFKVND